jgi:MOSC domain-containing protein YiiM
MLAKITALTRYVKKGEPGQKLNEVKLLTGLGMEGSYQQGGERQLCLLTAEIREWMDLQSEKGLCFRRFKENILIEGLANGVLLPNTLLQTENVILRTSESRKHCFEECRFVSESIRCWLSECVVFATVEQGGTVKVGDYLRISE